MSLNPKDLIIKSWPPKPRKGMQTGEVPPGVQITHVPTGEQVIANHYRYQHLNRELALKELSERIQEADHENR